MKQKFNGYVLLGYTLWLHVSSVMFWTAVH